MNNKERDFQSAIIKKIKNRFEGSMVLKNDPNYIQGIPDLLVLCNNRWAALEVKISGKANVQPNQEHYISKMNEMSYASFITPENEKEVFDDLEQTFKH